jgi:membrane-associated phospholipid phosphatase
MLTIIKKNKAFFIPYIIFLIISALILVFYSKAEIHIAINQVHNTFFDVFFHYYTYLGDDTILISFTLILFFIRYRLAFILASANIGASILLQWLKRGPFTDFPRPLLYFKEYYEGTYNLYLVPGENVGIWYPFPSGHTKAAFMLFTFLVLVLLSEKRGFLKIFGSIVFFSLALLVGYSRMYLSQHFFMDVAGGSLIGLLFTLIAYYYFNKIDKKWLDESLLSRLKNQTNKSG